MMLGRPAGLKLVPATSRKLVAALPSRPCHWKPKSAASCGRRPRRSCSRCRPARGGCRAGRSRARTWRYSGSGAVMISELVAGSAWMKPPVDGWADALPPARRWPAARLPSAGAPVPWGCVAVNGCRCPTEPPPPAAACRRCPKGRAQHRWPAVASAFFRCTTHMPPAGPWPLGRSELGDQWRARWPAGRVGGAHDQRVAARSASTVVLPPPPPWPGTAGADAAFGQRCTSGARSLATACCSGTISMSVAAGWSSAAMILADALQVVGVVGDDQRVVARVGVDGVVGADQRAQHRHQVVRVLVAQRKICVMTWSPRAPPRPPTRCRPAAWRRPRAPPSAGRRSRPPRSPGRAAPTGNWIGLAHALRLFAVDGDRALDARVDQRSGGRSWRRRRGSRLRCRR
jgi:hypothetical protein